MPRITTAALGALVLWATAAAAPARGATTLRSDTAPVELAVPDGWTKLPRTASTDPMVALTATNAAVGQGLAVVFEPKRKSDIALDDYAAAALAQMGKRSSDMTHTDWQHVKVGQADALQCDMHLTRARFKLGYVVTVFTTPDSYDQVLAYTIDSRFAASRPLLVGLSSGFRQTGPAPAPRATSGGPVTVKAKDGVEEMVLPADWAPTKEKTTRDTQLLVVNADEGQFVQLISENRADFTFDLRQYADTVLGNMIRHGTDGSQTPWQKLTVNGHDALRCDVRLTVSHMKLAYVYTVVAAPERFQQVLAWTYPSAFDAAKPTLEGLAADLRPIPLAH